MLFRRFLKGLAIVAAAMLVLAGLLALSIPVDAYLRRDALDALTNTSFGQNPPVRAYLAEPEGEGPHPVVIMLHEFWGLREDILEKAEALSEEGYLVAAPDTFRGASTGWLPRAIWQTLRTPEDRVSSDLDKVFAELVTRPDVDPERVMIMGFCYGGGKALLYSLTNPQLRATAVFYGSLITEAERLETLPGPVLGIFGAEDRSIPLSEVAAFEAALSIANVPHEVRVYEDVGHAFVGDLQDIRAGGADAEAWDAFLQFSAEQLKN